VSINVQRKLWEKFGVSKEMNSFDWNNGFS
jgi:hypothetical protein